MWRMLPNGTLTYSVTLTDIVGNTGIATTGHDDAEQTAPVGYTITPDQITLNSTTAGPAGFTFANAEVGTTYSYTISSGSATPVTGSGTVTSATQTVTGINVASLPERHARLQCDADQWCGAGQPATGAATLS